MSKPNKYSCLGKSTKCLFSTLYDYNFSLETTNKAKDGLTMTSGFSMEDGKTRTGSAQLQYEDESFGNVVVNMKVNGSNEDEDTNIQCTFNKLAKGLNLALSCNVIPELAIEKTFTKDSVVINSRLTSDTTLSKASWSGNGAFTYNNFALGLHGAVDLVKKEPDTVDLALQFSQCPHTVSAIMKKLQSNEKKFVLGYHTSCCDDWQLGFEGTVSEKTVEEKNEKVKTWDKLAVFGFNYSVNPTTTLKAKMDTKCKFSYAVEHQLSNPPLKVNFAHELQPCGGDFKATNWGFGLTFGDY